MSATATMEAPTSAPQKSAKSARHAAVLAWIGTWTFKVDTNGTERSATIPAPTLGKGATQGERTKNREGHKLAVLQTRMDAIDAVSGWTPDEREQVPLGNGESAAARMIMHAMRMGTLPTASEARTAVCKLAAH